MAKYTSGRQKNLKVGLTSYSENKTSLEVIGKVGIGTTKAASSLHVVGDQNVTGISTLGTVKISSGIVTSSNPGLTTVTFVGNLTGTATTAGFAFTAFKLEGFDFDTTVVGFASTATNVIGGIASVIQLSVSGVSTFGNSTSGIKIDGTTGIITSNTGIAITFIGNLTGTASTASFATTSINVIGGIASVTQLSVSGVSTVGILTASKIGIGTTNPTSEFVVIGNSSISGIVTIGAGNTGVTIDGVNGIVTSSRPGVTTVTYFGNLKGNSDTTSKLKTAVNIGGVSFDGSGNINLPGVNAEGNQSTSGTAASAGNLNFGSPNQIYFRNSANATTSNNFTFDGNNLKVSGLTTASSLNISGVSTFGVSGGTDGVVIKTENGAGIVTSSNPGLTTVTYYGTLIGTAQVNVENVTNTSNVIGGIASVTDLRVSGLSTVGVLTATKIGIGTTNPTSELVVIGDIFSTGITTLGTVKISSGIVTSTTGTAVTFVGNLTGTATTSGFARTAFGLETQSALSIRVGFATTARDVIGGIASVTDLKVTGISTFGNSTTGIKIDGTTGIITSNTGVAVTFFGNLTGTASTASFATTAFSLQGFVPSTGSVGFATTATNLGVGSTGSLPYQSSAGITSFLSAPGSEKQILIYDLDNNKPKWGNVSEGAGFASFGGITVREEGADVGTASSITVLNFVGRNIVAIASSGANGIATITMSDNLVGTALSISGISTFGNASTGIKIDGNTGIITSNTGTAVTFFGNLTGTATTAGFAQTAFGLNTQSALSIRVGFATTARDVIGGIGSLTDLKVTGISTFGTSDNGVVIKTENGLGIITSSSSGVGTVTYFGDGSKLTGIKGASVENQASTDTPVFLTLASNAGVSSIGISTTNAIALSFTPSSGNLGIGTTSASQKLWVNGNAFFGGTGIVTAVEYNGNLKFGTPSGTGFKAGAVAITTTSNTKDAVNDINFILGKLVPKAPATIDNRPLSLTGLFAPISTTGLLCNFSPGSPINNDPNTVTPTPGSSFSRNTDNTISTLTISQGNTLLLRGPGNSGTVTALLNFGNGIGVGVGTVTLTDGSNNGTFGNLVISSDQDAVVTGITSGFYEVYDASVSNAICSDGFNSVCIRHVDGGNTYLTTKAVWYEDGSTVSSPILIKTTPITPPSPSTVFSSGVPHYTESTNNAFSYIISCENATGDMYSSSINQFLSSSGTTSGFSDAGNKTYTDFFGGTNPPARNFGVGTAVTCLISQRPRSDVHTTVTTDAEKFSTYTVSTLYGTGTANTRATITQSVNIMGTAPSNTRIDESIINVTNGTSGIRVGSGSSSYDTPVPVFPTWVSSSTVPTHEAVVRGGVLRHDVQNYSTGFLPVGPDYSVGRSGSQYFQVKFVQPQITSFNMTISGRIAGCWVCLVDSQVKVDGKTWVGALTGNGNFGWGDMFQVYSGSGAPTLTSPGTPGCASAVAMNDSTNYSNTTFTCTFGQQGSGAIGTILVRWKLTSTQTLTSMTFTV